MNASMPFLILMMLLGGGSGTDLLDLVPSDAYWKAKDVDFTAASIMLELNSIKPDDTSKATAVRRLMAIRTLGELKSPDAVSSLKQQLDSKETFVADYAQRAIDNIEGTATTQPSSGVPPDRMKQDLYMLPEHCGSVGQVRLLPGKMFDMKKLLVTAATSQPGDAGDQPQPDTGKAEMTAGLITLAELTGNIRVDGITLAVSDDVGEQKGFIVMYIRGKWDADAVKAAIQTEFNQTTTAGEVEFMKPPGNGQGIGCAVVSDEFFVLATGPNAGSVPFEDIGAAIKSGKGKFEDSTDLVKVINSIDTTQPFWGAMLVGDNYKQAPMLTAFDSLTLVGKPTDDGVSFEAKGAGQDADAVKSAVDQMNNIMGEARGEVGHVAEQNPMIQPFADFMTSIELKSDGMTATGTGTMKRPK
jgi:hypothetical protein